MLLPNVTEETEPRKPGEEFDAELCFARRLRKQLVPPPPNTHTPRSGAGAFGELLSSSVAVLTHPQHPPPVSLQLAFLHSFIPSFFHSQTMYGTPAQREAASETKMTLLQGGWWQVVYK